MEREQKITNDEIKVIALNLMKVFHRFCEEKGIRYYMAFGTLLGAVRHRGFIPWDDDIDVEVLRSDYERIIREFNGWCEEDVELIAYETNEEFYLPYAKLIDTNTVLVEQIDHPIPIGVYFDIFPIDEMSDDKGKAIKLIKKSAFRNRINGLKMYVVPERWLSIKCFAHVILKTLLHVFKRKNIIERLIEISKTYESDGGASRYMGCVVSPDYKESQIMESDWYSDRILLPFEDGEFYAPVGYDHILRNLYGNYMEFPPKEQQVTHHSFYAVWK